MLPYLLSFGIGVGVGVIYAFTGVRSPAPPVIALLGLLGMLAGEAAISYLRGHPDTLATLLHRKSFSPGSSTVGVDSGPKQTG
jgi:XapX domain-containing protein